MTEWLFADGPQTLRFLREVEKGLIVALGWMPYVSDVPDDQKATLMVDLETHRAALDDVREARQSVEWLILDEAAGE